MIFVVWRFSNSTHFLRLYETTRRLPSVRSLRFERRASTHPVRIELSENDPNIPGVVIILIFFFVPRCRLCQRDVMLYENAAGYSRNEHATHEGIELVGFEVLGSEAHSEREARNRTDAIGQRLERMERMDLVGHTAH
jgi:hypothetical protein